MIKQINRFFLIFVVLLFTCSVYPKQSSMVITVEENREAVISKLTSVLQDAAKKAIEEKGVFNVGVSGGSIVDFLVTGLSKINANLSKWKIFFCDERVVPEDSADSTYGVYKRKMIDSGSVNLKPEQFVTIKQNVTAEEAAVAYENEIKKLLGGDSLPSFDLLLLGMGPDGHTCSLFPGHKLLNETSRWVAPITDSPKPPPSRVTLTFPVINNAKLCVFAIAGKDKADMVKRILVDKEDLPAGRVKPTTGELYWILEKESGAHVIQ